MVSSLITIISIITALLVVTSSSTVYSVLWLVGTFLIMSVLLALLNLGFTALLYVIVYVGAIAILFLFVVQLLDLGTVSLETHTESTSTNKTSGSLIAIITISLLTILFGVTNDISTFSSLFYNETSISLFIQMNSNLSVSEVVSIIGTSPQISSIALWFYGPGLLPLIVISLILLVAMIAPISLCKE